MEDEYSEVLSPFNSRPIPSPLS